MVRTKNHVLIIATAAIAGSLLYFFVDPAYSRIFPPCPFFTITGLFCPGCGSQRAFHDLLHGDVYAAAGHNLLFVSAVPILGISALTALNNIFRKKHSVNALFHSYSFAVGISITVIAFWILRNIPVVPFSWLAP